MSTEAVPQTREERIRFIVEVMRRNEWPQWPASRPFRQRLAEMWGCAEATIRDYAAEAHRVIAIDPAERAELQEQLGKKLLAIADEARASQNTQTGLPDFPSAIRATETAAKFLGIELAADKVKVTGGIALTSLDELRKAVEGDDTGRGG